MFAKMRAKSRSKVGCFSIIALLFLCSLPAVFTQERGNTAPNALVDQSINAPVELPTTAPVEAPTNPPVELPTNTPTELPPIVPVVLPTSTPTELPPVLLPIGATVNNGANLRSGPGTDYPVLVTAAAGTPLTIVGRNSAGDWVQTDSGLWISAGLVNNAPTDLAVMAAPPPPAPTAVVVAAPVQPVTAPIANVPATGNSNPDAFVCNGGCTQPPPGATCVIKGNVNSSNERIYHVPGGRHYTRTDIKPEEGDRWFCTAAEAVAAGFRASEN